MIAPYLSQELREAGMPISADFVHEYMAEFEGTRLICTENRKRWRYPIESAAEIVERNLR